MVPAGGLKAQGGPKSGKKIPLSPKPYPGSDSDVRPVADGSDVSFSLPKDSDIKLADSDVKVSPEPLKPKSSVSSASKKASQVSLGSGVQKGSKPGLSAKQPSPRPSSGSQPVDSGVRLVPMDSDSDMKSPPRLGRCRAARRSHRSSHGDSNVRLERVKLPADDSGEGTMMQTEEINLDEEIRKQEERDKTHKPTKLKAKSQVKFPTTSPFEAVRLRNEDALGVDGVGPQNTRQEIRRAVRQQRFRPGDGPQNAREKIQARLPTAAISTSLSPRQSGG